ncbi:TRAP-type C4-dicarboxylate transport system permease small subunit [Actinomadura coerulea]|uniref:TRAP-type C4-dicarboxylate transport system permease small subunit n=1 Tax=Actinomadura coerulea TaxID=46159 RepID=A0A7X0KWB4_9ACTN|nr:TRAP-type C4-dicarboxylate transport system permease small subunit [Actinomadura coerulea]
MTIGGSIALIIIGAILAYAVNYDISGIDIRLVGVILMIGGVIGLVIGIVRMMSARRAVDRRPPPAAVREEYYPDEYEARRRY